MLKIFISYSHEDEKPWKNLVVKHLRVLEREGMLELWDDRRIKAGDDWYAEIEKAINESRIAVLLITTSFLTSEFIREKEVPKLLEKREKEGMRIIPLIVRPCAWDEIPWLNKINARPKDGRPLSGGTDHQIDLDLTELTKEIVKISGSSASSKAGFSAPSEDAGSTGPSLPISIKSESGSALDSPEARGVFGREKNIREAIKELKNVGILTIYGMPGIGKSVLIDEIRKQSEKTFQGYASYRLNETDSVVQIYTQLAHILGCRDTNPMDKFDLIRKFNYSPFQEFAKYSKPFLICFDKGHLLYEEGYLASREIIEFINAITRYYPKSRIILESQEQPPVSFFNSRIHKTMKITGIDKESMCHFYKRPFRDIPDIGWELTKIDAQSVFERLGGKRAQGGAHPLAMNLLAIVSAELAETPTSVLDRPEHKEKYDLALEASLFSDLYEKVLSYTERHALRLCSLYIEDIPDAHVDILNKQAGGDGFTKLIRLCLLNPRETGEWYALHSVIKDLTRKKADKKELSYSSDHEAIANAWLSQLKFSSHPSPPNIRKANAAFYHLSEAECYRRLYDLSEKLLSKNIIPSLYDIQKQQRDKGKFESAIAALELILRLDDNEHKAHRFLADCIETLHERGHPDALFHFRKAYELDPTYPHYLNGLGRCLLARDEPAAFVGIIDHLDKPAFDKVMTDNHNRALFATCLEKVGRGPEASALRRQRIDNGSRNSVFYAGEANYLSDQGNYKAALEIIQLAEQRKCIDDYTVNIKAKVLEAMGRGSEASKIRQQQIANGSQHSATYTDEASFLSEQGDGEGALKLLRLAESRGWTNHYTLSVKTKILATLGRDEEASQLRKEQIKKRSRHSVFYNDEAKFLSSLGKHNEALDVILQAESLYIANEYTFAIKASVMQAVGRHIEASSLRKEYIFKGSRNVAFYNDHAKYLLGQREFEAALAVIQRAEEMKCADAHSIVTKAVILEALGRGSAASELRKEQIDKDVPDPAFYNDEAKYLKDLSKLKEALGIIEKAERLTFIDEYTLAIKASLLSELGRESEAADIRREHINKGTKNPAFYTDEAKYLCSLGDREGAVSILTIAEKRGFATEYTTALKESILKSLG